MESFPEFLKLMRLRLSERGYRRHGSNFIRGGGEVDAKVNFQRTSSSSKGDPWLFVNWGLSVVSLLRPEERSMTLGNCMIFGRLENERRESREFRLAAYPSVQAGVDVIWPYLVPILDYMDSVRSEADVLKEIEGGGLTTVGGGVLGTIDRAIERLRFAPRHNLS